MSSHKVFLENSCKTLLFRGNVSFEAQLYSGISENVELHSEFRIELSRIADATDAIRDAVELVLGGDL